LISLLSLVVVVAVITLPVVAVLVDFVQALPRLVAVLLTNPNYHFCR
jgi:hypothetical protein